MSIEQKVASHYEVSGLTARLLAALEGSGVDRDHVTLDDLAEIDEFHIGGRPATDYFAAKLDFARGGQVLDVGCGVGGPARRLAAHFGCTVTGIDLTPAFVETAAALSATVGMTEQTAFREASALDMPFADGFFDGAFTIHVAMNIRDRAGLYGEIARVLKPGAVFGMYDVMKGSGEGFDFPVPWSEVAATSHLTTPDELRALLGAAGFEVIDFEDRTEAVMEAQRRSRKQAGGGLTIELARPIVMGANFQEKGANLMGNIEAGRINPAIMIARRLG